METYFNVKADSIENINFDIKEDNVFTEKIENNIPVQDCIFIKEKINNDITPNIFINNIVNLDTVDQTTIDTKNEINSFIINENINTNISI